MQSVAVEADSCRGHVRGISARAVGHSEWSFRMIVNRPGFKPHRRWSKSVAVDRLTLLAVSGLACLCAIGCSRLTSSASSAANAESVDVAHTAAHVDQADGPTVRWQCHNDVEIQCTQSACDVQAAESTTPLSVTFDNAGEMAVCAYSGCWEGRGDVASKPPFLLLVGTQLQFSSAPQDAAAAQNIAIVLDPTDDVATLKAGAFALPLRCTRL